MRYVRVRTLSLLAVAAAGACTRSPRPETTVTESATPCTGRDGLPENEEWREIATEAFTFCVPSNWRPDGRRTWSGGEVSITWGLGRSQFYQGTPMPSLPGQTPVASSRYTVETIDGVPVEIRSIDFGQRYSVFAEWKEPALQLFGTGPSRGSQLRSLEIIRTVRLRKP